MDEMMAFSLWFLQTIPEVLLKPPISAFLGLALVAWTCHLVGSLMHLK